MIECVFTLDYEIYGNGSGRLEDLVLQPARRLRDLFLRHGVRFVNFVEVAEFEKIETLGTDPAIAEVARQIRELFEDGFETGLHLHPQWGNAVYRDGAWQLDYSEYNLCTLPPARIAQIVDRGLAYLRRVLGSPSFTPLCFRAGNWLFQPTQPAAGILSQRGIRIDSSVFKGGLQRSKGLDYRASLKNSDYWSFDRDANEPDLRGPLLELPIHARMVPFWQMLTYKRLGFKNSATSGRKGTTVPKEWLLRLSDFLRVRYPLKLDFCRMTLAELTGVMDQVIREDQRCPGTLRPIVAIGHTKDLTELKIVDSFLSYLRANSIGVSTFGDLYPRLLQVGASFPVRDDPAPQAAILL